MIAAALIAFALSMPDNRTPAYYVAAARANARDADRMLDLIRVGAVTVDGERAGEFRHRLEQISGR